MSATLAAAMRWMMLVFLVALAAGCSNAPSEADCKKLLDKTVELEAAESQKKPLEMAPEDRDAFITECVEELPRGRVACALKATTRKEMLACDES